ncbi:MAG: hypothetical protein Q7J69_03880 [Candidatus Omnitrophota bacterium]|nr:hypothetical protein [Candidatus Omnitrophota bacterium]
MRLPIWILAFACALCTVPPVAALAETTNEEVAYELKEMKKALQVQNQLIQKQQAKIDELERRLETGAGSKVVYPEPALPEPTGARAPAPAGKGLGLPGQIGALLPEIGLVGDIVATTSEDAADTEGNDRISAREVELVVGSNVDPYSRFDASFAFSDFEETSLEEAYLTRWGLPWDLKARFGRFFPRVGKAASIHRDSLSTVDEPLVIRRYFGAEGFARSGADIGGTFQGPLSWVFEPSVGILEGGMGEGGTMFGTTRRRPTAYGHWKNYRDLSDSSGVELGFTGLIGSSDADPEFEVKTLGVDVTYLNAFTPTTKMKLQSELFVQQRDESFAIDPDTGETRQFDRHPWGAYALAEYRFAPQWAVGARADHVRLVDSAQSRHYDQGVSAFLTFYQSEWARWRLQFRHEERARDETDDNAVFLQGTFAIGTHKHQIQ